MKKVETLTKIKEAEEQAKQMKSDALKERETIIRNAKRESLFVLENMEREAAELHKEKSSEVEAEIQRERSRLLEEGKQKGETLKNQASAKIDEAVDFLIKRFEDGVFHAETKGDE